jgi:glycine/serine hydroxymethyltransferase
MLYDKSEEAVLERARINRYLTSIFEKLVIDFPGKKLHTEVKETFKGKVSELVATISVPHDNRFKAKPTGTVRIGGTSMWRGPAHDEFTAEEMKVIGSIPAVVVEPIHSKTTLEHISAKLKTDAEE